MTFKRTTSFLFAAELYLLDALIQNVENVVFGLDFQKIVVHVQDKAKALHLLLTLAVNQQGPLPNQIMPFQKITPYQKNTQLMCFIFVLASSEKIRTITKTGWLSVAITAMIINSFYRIVLYKEVKQWPERK